MTGSQSFNKSQLFFLLLLATGGDASDMVVKIMVKHLRCYGFFWMKAGDCWRWSTPLAVVILGTVLLSFHKTNTKLPLSWLGFPSLSLPSRSPLPMPESQVLAACMMVAFDLREIMQLASKHPTGACCANNRKVCDPKTIRRGSTRETVCGFISLWRSLVLASHRLFGPKHAANGSLFHFCYFTVRMLHLLLEE